MTLVDACYYNELTCADEPDMTYTIKADGTAADSPAGEQDMLSCTQSVVDNDGNDITTYTDGGGNT